METRISGEPDVIWLHCAEDMRDALRHPARWLSGRRKIGLRHMPESDRARARIERRLNLWLSICGCQLAAFAFLAVILFRLWSANATGQLDAWAFATALAAALSVAIAIKLAAIIAYVQHLRSMCCCSRIACQRMHRSN